MSPDTLSDLFLVAFQHAVAEADDAVGMVGNVLFVGDEDHGVASGMDLPEYFHDLVGSLGIEVTGRLIGEYDGRIVHQCPRDGDPLVLPAGQFIGLVMAPVGQVYFIQHMEGFLHPLLLGHARIDQGQGHIFGSSKAWQQVELLENKADLFVPHFGQVVVGHLAYVLAVQHIGAGSGCVEAAKNIHQGTLTRTRRPHQGYIFVPENVQRNSLQHLYNLLPEVIILPDIFQMYNAQGYLIFKIWFLAIFMAAGALCFYQQPIRTLSVDRLINALILHVLQDFRSDLAQGVFVPFIVGCPAFDDGRAFEYGCDKR